MIVIRDIVTGAVMLATTRYAGLKVYTDAVAGMAGMEVGLERGVAGLDDPENWHGQLIEFNDVTGQVHKGRIESIAISSTHFTLLSVGIGAAFLSDVPISGTYYDNEPSKWKAPIENVTAFPLRKSAGFVLSEGDTRPTIGLKGNYTFATNEEWGYSWKNPHVLYAASNDPLAKWINVTFDYVAAGTGGISIRMHEKSASGSWSSLTSWNVGTGTGSVTLERFPSAAAEILITAQINSGFTPAAGTSDNFAYVRLSKIEWGILNARPTVYNVLADVLRRSERGLFVPKHRYTTVNVDAPLVFDYLPGLQAVEQCVNMLKRQWGVEWSSGFWNNNIMELAQVQPEPNGDPVMRWVVTGENDDHSIIKSFDNYVGEPVGGRYTHIRARYEDNLGDWYGTVLKETGISLPHARIKEYISRLRTSSEATAEATNMANLMATRSPRGTFTIKGQAQTAAGVYLPLTAVRAGQWVTLETAHATARFIEQDTRKGGMIGKTTYDHDAQTLTIELIGATHPISLVAAGGTRTLLTKE